MPSADPLMPNLMINGQYRVRLYPNNEYSGSFSSLHGPQKAHPVEMV